MTWPISGFQRRNRACREQDADATREVHSADAVARYTSFYGRPGGWRSRAWTRANIAEAIRRGIPLRVGLIGVADGQRAEAARAQLEAMGVTAIGTDGMRNIGRAAASPAPDVSQLCGRCGRGSAAIGPFGDVWPCVFSRWMMTGNIQKASLAAILSGPEMASAVAQISGGGQLGCSPPPCSPDSDGNDCRPAVPSTMCLPHSCRPNRPCSPNAGDGCGPSACRPNR